MIREADGAKRCCQSHGFVVGIEKLEQIARATWKQLQKGTMDGFTVRQVRVQQMAEAAKQALRVQQRFTACCYEPDTCVFDGIPNKSALFCAALAHVMALVGSVLKSMKGGKFENIDLQPLFKEVLKAKEAVKELPAGLIKLEDAKSQELAQPFVIDVEQRLKDAAVS